MMKVFTPGSLITIMVLRMGSITDHNPVHGYSGELTAEESLPFLQALSKLYRITTVRNSPFGTYRTLPHFCWVTDRKGNLNLSKIGETLKRYEGSADWFFVEDMP